MSRVNELLQQQLLMLCEPKVKSECKKLGKNINDQDAKLYCKEMLNYLLSEKHDDFWEMYNQILTGVSRRESSLILGARVAELASSIGGGAAYSNCKPPEELEQGMAETFRVNRAPGGGLPEAAAYSVTGAVGVFNRKDEFTIGGIVVLGLALVLLNWRYSSFRFVTSRASHFFSRFVY